MVPTRTTKDACVDFGEQSTVTDTLTLQTLAVGVNLPAHTVVIKGTVTWNGPVTGFREYSDIEIQVSRNTIAQHKADRSK